MDHCASNVSPRGRALHRIVLFVGIGVAVVAVHLAIYWPLLGQKEAESDKAGKAYEKSDIDHAIEQEQINPLRGESLEESLAKLSDVEMFFWPGVPRESLSLYLWTLPLRSSVGGRDVQTIMSNRRFLRVYEGLSKLPKAKAADLINRQIESGLPVYSALFDQDLEAKKDSIKADVKPKVVGSYQGSNNKDGTPTVLGMRYKLLALALIAGNLGVQDCRPTVAKLARHGSQSYQTLQRKDLYNHYSAYAIIEGGSLYNRQILGTALLATSGRLNGLTAGADKYRVATKSEEVTHYDARATRFDLHGRIGVVPVDYSKGRLTVRYLGDISDLTFEEILALVEREDR